MRFNLLRRSLARRIIVSLFLACALVWVGLYLFGIHLTQSHGGSFDQNLVRIADTIAGTAAKIDDPEQIGASLDGLALFFGAAKDPSADPSTRLVLRVSTRAGKILYGNHAQDPFAGTVLDEGLADVDVDGVTYRVLMRSLEEPALRIVVATTLATRRQNYNRVMFSRDSLAIPFLGGFVLLLLVELLTVRIGLRPLVRLSDELAARAPGDLRRLDTPDLHQELVPVASALNTTLDRLAEKLRQEQQFLADAAHELRTPIALIAAQAETLSSAEDGGQRAQAAARLRKGIERTRRLVDQLLAMARLESGIEASPRRIDLVEEAADVLAALDREAHEKRVTLSLQAPERLDAWMAGDHFAILLGNLVSNAIRHGRRDGQVLVHLSETDGQVRLTVSDDGPGIERDRQDQAFQRFHRLDHASGHGAGLGLSIVTTVVRQLAGQLKLSTGINGRGLAVMATWPQRAAP